MSLIERYKACKTEGDLESFLLSLFRAPLPKEAEEFLTLADFILDKKTPLKEIEKEMVVTLAGAAYEASPNDETSTRALKLAERLLSAKQETPNKGYTAARLPGSIAAVLNPPASFLSRALEYLEKAALSSSSETCLGVLESLGEIARQDTPPEEKERFFGLIANILQKEWTLLEAFSIADTAKDCLRCLIKTFDCAPYRERIESIVNMIDLCGTEYPALTEADPSSGIQVCAILSHKEANRIILGERLLSSASLLILDDGPKPVENLAAFLTDPAADLLSSPSGLKAPAQAQAQKAFREAQKQAAQAQTRKIKQPHHPSQQMGRSPRSSYRCKK